MQIEEQLKQLILSKYSSLKAFSDHVGISNSTIDSIIKRGVKNANINNIITICRALNIDVDELANGNIISRNIKSMAYREKSLITKYRQLNADGQNKVDEYTTDLVDSGKYSAEENTNTDDKTASVTDFKPVNKGRVIRGRAVAFGGATLETEIDEDTAREISELRRKIDKKQENN